MDNTLFSLVEFETSQQAKAIETERERIQGICLCNVEIETSLLCCRVRVSSCLVFQAIPAAIFAYNWEWPETASCSSASYEIGHDDYTNTYYVHTYIVFVAERLSYCV